MSSISSELMFAIGERIAEERNLWGYTQESLAVALESEKPDTYRNQISKWENGKAVPSTEMVLKMSELFRCDVGYLLCQQDCESHEFTDITEATGLSEEAVNALRYDKRLDSGIISMLISLTSQKQLRLQIHTANRVLGTATSRMNAIGDGHFQLDEDNVCLQRINAYDVYDNYELEKTKCLHSLVKILNEIFKDGEADFQAAERRADEAISAAIKEQEQVNGEHH